MTGNKQETINSGCYVLKEANLLHSNDGIWSKIYVSFHPFFLLFFNDFEPRFTMVEETQQKVI